MKQITNTIRINVKFDPTAPVECWIPVPKFGLESLPEDVKEVLRPLCVPNGVVRGPALDVFTSTWTEVVFAASRIADKIEDIECEVLLAVYKPISSDYLFRTILPLGEDVEFWSYRTPEFPACTPDSVKERLCSYLISEAVKRSQVSEEDLICNMIRLQEELYLRRPKGDQTQVSSDSSMLELRNKIVVLREAIGGSLTKYRIRRSMLTNTSSEEFCYSMCCAKKAPESRSIYRYIRAMIAVLFASLELIWLNKSRNLFR